MTLLIIGTIIFFGIHMVPSAPFKPGLVASLGAKKYKMIFSIFSLLGLGLIIYGFSLSSFVPLWDPLPWGRSVAFATMPLAVIMMCAADMPNNIKRFVRHPMLIGLILWSGPHLAANGDLASTILFLSFGLFALLDFFLVSVGGRYKAKKPVSFLWDIAVVVVGLILYSVLFYFHGSFTGMPL
jgi:uncharacterized membrane protein